MVFIRNWDSTCPRVWDAWEADGNKWTIEDLAPEDDDTVMQLLFDHFVEDEVLFNISRLVDDPVSVRNVRIFWKLCLEQRMSLACYIEKDGKKTLVGANVLVVECEGEKFPDFKKEGGPFNNIFDAVDYVEYKRDPFKYLGLDKFLYGLGLVVKAEYRGFKLGKRILAARKALSLAHGLYASATVFTGPASQIQAERCGFETIYTASFKELTEDAHLNYPLDENRVIKLMVLRYTD